MRYMARVRWEDRISSEEVAKRCGLKMIRDKLRQRRLQWFGHVNGSIGEKERRKTMENLERYSEEGFGTNRSGRECGIGSRQKEKVHRKSDVCLRGKYGLKR